MRGTSRFNLTGQRRVKISVLQGRCVPDCCHCPPYLLHPTSDFQGIQKSGLEKARKSGSLSTGVLNNTSRASDQSCRLTSRVCTVSSKSTGRNALRGDYCVSEDHYCSKQRSSQGRGTSSRILVYTRRYQRNSGYVMQLSESARPAYRQSRDPDTVD